MKINWIFTDRKGGASVPPFSAFNLARHVGDAADAVAANRERLSKQIGGVHIVWMDQTHSANVKVVDDATAEPIVDTDGLVTRIPNLALAVMVADCVPVLAYDDTAGVIAVAHAGRLGAAAGIGTRLLDTLVALGAAPKSTHIILGPAICGSCYEVPAAMAHEVAQRLPGSASRTAAGTPGLDLRAGLRQQLRAAGVAHVEIDRRCTLEDPDLFSHRRQEPTGRQAGLIWLTPETSAAV